MENLFNEIPAKNIPYTVINQGPAADEASLSYASYAVILGYTYYFSRTGEWMN